jgi:hypothetical protein
MTNAYNVIITNYPSHPWNQTYRSNLTSTKDCEENENLEIILNLSDLTMNAINNLLQRRHSGILSIVPNKSRSNTKTTISANKNKLSTDQRWKERKQNLVKYESTGTPSTVRPAVLTPETRSSSSIWRLILLETPSMKALDCIKIFIDQIKDNYAIEIIRDREIERWKRKIGKLTLVRSSLRERRESRVPTRRLGMLNCEDE